MILELLTGQTIKKKGRPGIELSIDKTFRLPPDDEAEVRAMLVALELWFIFQVGLRGYWGPRSRKPRPEARRLLQTYRFWRHSWGRKNSSSHRGPNHLSSRHPSR